MDVSALQAQLRAFAVERDWPPFHSPKNLAMALMVEVSVADHGTIAHLDPRPV